MKKMNVWGLIFGAFVLLSACSKVTEENEQKTFANAVAKKITLSASGAEMKVQSTGGQAYLLETETGHLYTTCKGSCGKTHVNTCSGIGTNCEGGGVIILPNSLELVKSADGVKAKTYSALCVYENDFSNEEVFLFPNRSFLIEAVQSGQAQFLNIPEQTFERDPNTHTFVIQGVTFTEKALFINE